MPTMQAQFADVIVLSGETEWNFVTAVMVMVGGYVIVAVVALSMCKRGSGSAWSYVLRSVHSLRE